MKQPKTINSKQFTALYLRISREDSSLDTCPRGTRLANKTQPKHR